MWDNGILVSLLHLYLYGLNLSWWASLLLKISKLSQFWSKIAPTWTPHLFTLHVFGPFLLLNFLCLFPRGSSYLMLFHDILKPQKQPTKWSYRLFYVVFPLSLSLSLGLSLSLSLTVSLSPSLSVLSLSLSHTVPDLYTGCLDRIGTIGTHFYACMVV